ncbi:hypothetical protein [Mycolicibacterium aubagnense]|uniref:hypothetical protein n=1 Tax=Mycolicibacterium aubagnense TaxID=319707 RepID=UPI0010FE2705|nr:hypothetical protein [Mycolicibacterium aubagnense]
MPDEGWPTKLFARRDAMLLVLATAGVSGSRIAQLRLGDVVVDAPADRLAIQCVGGETANTCAGSALQGVSPVSIWEQWSRIRSIQHHLSNPRFLAAHLRGEPIPKIGHAPASLPVVTSIDRWGATPFIASALGAQSISRIITAHLTGQPTVHRRVQPVDPAIRPMPLPEAQPPGCAPQLDSATYSRGVAARCRAAAELGGVTEMLDDVEDRADRLLAGLLQLLDHQH